MTDLEIAVAAMTEWPEAYRPKNVDRSHGRFFCTTLCESDMEDHHAIDLFIVSGLSMLARKYMASKGMPSLVINAPEDSDDMWHIYPSGQRATGIGPTLFAAVDKAVRAITKESPHGN